jgi:MerR family mercuric resistance operon transcriptional regulator
MREGLTIAELADEASVPSSTIRYYERMGLFAPRGRTGGNYRFYDQSSLERLRFIKAAQAAGFTISDIQTLLAVRDGQRGPCREVRSLIEDRLSILDQKVRDLRHAEDVLRGLLHVCELAEQEGDCPAIEELTESSELPEDPK